LLRLGVAESFPQVSAQRSSANTLAKLNDIRILSELTRYQAHSETSIGTRKQSIGTGLAKARSRVVAFLASADSDFITGEALEVNGGAWIS